jgi:hypothetical protein
LRYHYFLYVLLGIILAVSGTLWYVGRVNSTHPAMWANPGGDEGRRNFVKDSLPSDPKLLWSYDLMAGLSPSPSRQLNVTPPVVWKDGTVYVGLGSKVHAVGPDGKRKWAWESKTPISNLALGRQGNVYAQADGMLYALKPDGTLEWQVEVPVLNENTRGMLIGQGGVIYVGGKEYLTAVSSAGERKWRFKGENISAGPVEMDDGKIAVMIGSQLYLLDREGNVVWDRQAVQPATILNLVTHGDKIYVNGTTGRMVFNKSGAILTNSPASATSYLVAVGSDFVQDGDTRFNAIWSESRWEADMADDRQALLGLADRAGNAVLFAQGAPSRLGPSTTYLQMVNAKGEQVWTFSEVSAAVYLPAAGLGRIWMVGYVPNSQSVHLICIGDR